MRFLTKTLALSAFVLPMSASSGFASQTPALTKTGTVKAMSADGVGEYEIAYTTTKLNKSTGNSAGAPYPVECSVRSRKSVLSVYYYGKEIGQECDLFGVNEVSVALTAPTRTIVLDITVPVSASSFKGEFEGMAGAEGYCKLWIGVAPTEEHGDVLYIIEKRLPFTAAIPDHSPDPTYTVLASFYVN